MLTITEDMRAVIAAAHLCFAATVSPEGRPNLSPKGTIRVWDERRLFFLDIASPGTRANLERSPWIELNVVETLSRRGYRFAGRAQLVRDGEVYAEATRRVFAEEGARFPVAAVVLVALEAATPLVSPGYMRLSDEPAMRAAWRERRRALDAGFDAYIASAPPFVPEEALAASGADARSMDAMAPAPARAPHPGDLAPEELRRAGADLIETIAAYHAGLAERIVLPAVTPAAVAARFAEPLAETGLSIAEQLADWRERVEPLLTAVGSPRHFAYVNGSGAMVGIFADALAASVNTNAGGWRLGPAAAEIERQSLRWLADLVGYPAQAGGIVLTGGTMANTTALLTALRHLAPYDSTPAGLQTSARRGRFLVYMADHEGHISVTRAADLINLGRDAVRRVPSRADFTLDPAALALEIAADRERGDLPLAVVAQVGSVNVGAIDPLDELADLCAAEGLWLHGDGACGLFAAALPELRGRLRGLARADSLSGDPHKWLGVPYDCGVLLVREGERLRRTFSITAPYLRATGESEERQGRDFLEYGPEMSRAWRALKLWMTLRALGRQGLREALGNGLELARYLHGIVAAHPDFATLHEPTLYLYCFRCVPRALAVRAAEPAVAEELDRLNQTIVDAVQASGLAFLMTTRIRGRVAIRLSICSQRTERTDIDRTFAALAAAAAAEVHSGGMGHGTRT
jgi:glutamate/tyrosine decarboxylase-like PLP-dependent enzyme/predicted pyridoxine 5'-phosphate oxidase superfamily flavin-nucleotide-binding protein